MLVHRRSKIDEGIGHRYLSRHLPMRDGAFRACVHQQLPDQTLWVLCLFVLGPAGREYHYILYMCGLVYRWGVTGLRPRLPQTLPKRIRDVHGARREGRSDQDDGPCVAT